MVALLLLLAASALYVGVRPAPLAEPPTVELASEDDSLVQADVRLVMVDATGLEWQKSERVRSGPGASERLTAVIAALREAPVGEGVWPEALPASVAFLQTNERRCVAEAVTQPP